MNGLDGWTCSIFRRVSGALASELILEAEAALAASGLGCGPDGLLTYVWDAKVASRNPGYCFKLAGWHVAGRGGCCERIRPRSADGRKTLLHKPFSLAGQRDAAAEQRGAERAAKEAERYTCVQPCGHGDCATRMSVAREIRARSRG